VIHSFSKININDNLIYAYLIIFSDRVLIFERPIKPEKSEEELKKKLDVVYKNIMEFLKSEQSNQKLITSLNLKFVGEYNLKKYFTYLISDEKESKLKLTFYETESDKLHTLEILDFISKIPKKSNFLLWRDTLRRLDSK
jgi:hypothetical protein